MQCYSFEFSIPDNRPFDQKETWFPSFVGTILLPVCESGKVRRFWFTNYGGIGVGKTALFRTETDDIASVEHQLKALCEANCITLVKRDDYDPHGDLGRGERSRFLGTNAKHQDPARRGELVFSMLHSAGLLMFDCLVGPDANGYFALEAETESGFSLRSSFEQFHHLFCNMTCAPTFIVLGQPPGSTGVEAITWEECKQLKRLGWKHGQPRNGMF